MHTHDTPTHNTPQLPASRWAEYADDAFQSKVVDALIIGRGWVPVVRGTFQLLAGDRFRLEQVAGRHRRWLEGSGMHVLALSTALENRVNLNTVDPGGELERVEHAPAAIDRFRARLDELGVTL